MHQLNQVIEQFYAIHIVSARCLSKEYQVFFLGELFRRFNRHLSIALALLFGFSADEALLAPNLLTVDHRILNQAVLHKVVELFVLVLGVYHGVFGSHGAPHDRGGVDRAASHHARLVVLPKGTDAGVRNVEVVNPGALVVYYIGSRDVRYASLAEVASAPTGVLDL